MGTKFGISISKCKGNPIMLITVKPNIRWAHNYIKLFYFITFVHMLPVIAILHKGQVKNNEANV